MTVVGRVKGLAQIVHDRSGVGEVGDPPCPEPRSSAVAPKSFTICPTPRSSSNRKQSSRGRLTPVARCQLYACFCKSRRYLSRVSTSFSQVSRMGEWGWRSSSKPFRDQNLVIPLCKLTSQGSSSAIGTWLVARALDLALPAGGTSAHISMSNGRVCVRRNKNLTR